jgi:lon-related putative ATP-dependent protease
MSDPTTSTSGIEELDTNSLCRQYNPSELDFTTTQDLDDVEGIVGQPRAAEALAFGFGIERKGFNIFALGVPGTGKRSFVRHYLDELARTRPTPPDLCYLPNFDEPAKPQLLELPAGTAVELRRDMEHLSAELRNAVTETFESEDYQSRRQAIQDEFKQRPERELTEVGERAKEQGLALLRTPDGLSFAPVRGEEVLSQEDFKNLPDDQRAQLEEAVEKLQEEVQQTLRQVPRWDRERRERLRELNREVTGFAASHLIDDVRGKYKNLPAVLLFLEAVQRNVIDHARELAGAESPLPGPLAEVLGHKDSSPSAVGQYRINVLVDNSATSGAPVVYEDNPTYDNLLGRVEHSAQLGALVTDFSLIKAGALHRANGGYLMLGAYKLLRAPYAWEGLKRALQAGCVRMEPLSHAAGMASAVSLDPEPLQLNVQVIVFGERTYYHLLHQLDPEFSELFKVAADFDTEMSANDENVRNYTHLLATLVRREGLRPFDRSAVARVLEHSARLAGHQDKLCAILSGVVDLMREADYRTGQRGADTVLATDVQATLDAQTYRLDRIRERYLDEIERGTIMIDTEGDKVGQVNALSVVSMGTFSFGHPNRVTARIRTGEGNVLDIEREVELGGPIHSKGVLILSSYLGAHYAADVPLSLSASLVFEQSYGGIDGDSASTAELVTLLSAVAVIPIKQSLAITGSVNQHGKVQAIGGVNEKVEGFFDLCCRRGLTGEQGVIIPAANVKHLMLRNDVAEAVGKGEFHIYPVTTVEQAMELLTGVPAGLPDAKQRYPKGSFNARVVARLAEMAESRRKFLGPPGSS